MGIGLEILNTRLTQEIAQLDLDPAEKYRHYIESLNAALQYNNELLEPDISQVNVLLVTSDVHTTDVLTRMLTHDLEDSKIGVVSNLDLTQGYLTTNLAKPDCIVANINPLQLDRSIDQINTRFPQKYLSKTLILSADPRNLGHIPTGQQLSFMTTPVDFHQLTATVASIINSQPSRNDKLRQIQPPSQHLKTDDVKRITSELGVQTLSSELKKEPPPDSTKLAALIHRIIAKLKE